MIFPIGDDQVKGGHFPLFSYGFIILNIIVFVYQSQFEGRLVCSYGALPMEILEGEDLYTLISSMFMHADFWHLLGNMLFLWVFADNIEATIGNSRFLVFYLLGGLAAVGTHIFFSMGPITDVCCFPCIPEGACFDFLELLPCPGAVPMVGASGAISAVLGAYLVMFPGSKIKLLFLVIPFRIPAFLFLGFWILEQWSSVASLGAATGGGVAWWAHIGGFIFGLIGGLYYRRYRHQFRHQMEEDGGIIRY
jgi:membrane associated rhomboid family serine protease